jgi:hypothetical protein
MVVALVVLIMSASSHVAPDAAAVRSFWPPLGLADSLTSVGGRPTQTLLATS